MLAEGAFCTGNHLILWRAILWWCWLRQQGVEDAPRCWTLPFPYAHSEPYRPSVAAQEEGRRHPGHTIQPAHGLLWVQEQWKGHAEMPGIALDDLEILTSIHPEHRQTLSDQVVVHLLQRRQLGTTLGTPGSPEVQQDHLSL